MSVLFFASRWLLRKGGHVGLKPKIPVRLRRGQGWGQASGVKAARERDHSLRTSPGPSLACAHGAREHIAHIMAMICASTKRGSIIVPVVWRREPYTRGRAAAGGTACRTPPIALMFGIWIVDDQLRRPENSLVNKTKDTGFVVQLCTRVLQLNS